LSAEFQKHVLERGKHFGNGVKISDLDADLAFREPLKAQLKALEDKFNKEKVDLKEGAIPAREAEYLAAKQLIEEKALSLKSVVYLLNFYEFLCAGIIQRELDERMIKETLVDIAVGLYTDTVNLRALARTQQPKVYCNLDRLVGAEWAQED
jgi:Domain of unknown function (DUF4760)